MRHAFLVALFVFIAGQGAQADDQTAPASVRRQLPEVLVVEDDGKGELLIALRGLNVARCAIVDEKLACKAINAKAEIVPAFANQPAPDGNNRSVGSP